MEAGRGTLAELTSKAPAPLGEILVVSEASFGPGAGAFRLDGSELQGFLREHQARFEPVFNGDLILVAPRHRLVLCIHHESHLIVISPPLAGRGAAG